MYSDYSPMGSLSLGEEVWFFPFHFIICLNELNLWLLDNLLYFNFLCVESDD